MQHEKQHGDPVDGVLSRLSPSVVSIIKVFRDIRANRRTTSLSIRSKTMEGSAFRSEPETSFHLFRLAPSFDRMSMVLSVKPIPPLLCFCRSRDTLESGMRQKWPPDRRLSTLTDCLAHWLACKRGSRSPLSSSRSIRSRGERTSLLRALRERILRPPPPSPRHC